MIVDWTELLTAWTFRPLLFLVLLGVAALYVRGWSRSTYPKEKRRPRLFALSLAVLFFALASPLNRLANTLFFLRVTQHLLTISLFPATFMGADPLPIIFNGLPRPFREILTRLGVRYRPLLTRMTPKGVCWFIFVAFVWLWYDPRMLDITMSSPLIYDLALAMMGLGALLHWWHVTAAWPRLHAPLPGLAHMGYTIAGAAPLKIPGLFLLFSVTPFYGYPTATLLGFEITPLLSQHLGGILVWVLGGSVYSTTAFRFLAAWFDTEESKPEQPRGLWDNEESLIAPHLE